MAGETASPTACRKLLCSLGSDEILEVIKDAIAVAARDHPQELEQGRESIVQMLLPPQSDEASALLLLPVSEQVAKIGSLLAEEEDEAVVMESLRALKGVRMTFETLQATKIGRVVSGLRKKKNTSEQLRRLAGDICKGWMALADEHFRSCRRASPTSTTSTDGVAQEGPKTQTACLKIAEQVRGLPSTRLQPRPRSSASCEHRIEPTSSIDEELMLATAKRKLTSGYQRAATARKQKSVQLIIAPERMMQPLVHRVVRRRT